MVVVRERRGGGGEERVEKNLKMWEPGCRGGQGGSVKRGEQSKP